MPSRKMTTHSNSEIASAWLQNCRDAIAHGSNSPIADQTFWAYSELDDLCSTDPSRALDIVGEILAQKPEERVRYNLAAGPLEVLLSRSGLMVASQIRDLALRYSDFRDLSGGVWTDDMESSLRTSSNLWSRIQGRATVTNRNIALDDLSIRLDCTTTTFALATRG